HAITATATNVAGNVSPSTGEYPFIVDTQAPSASAGVLTDDVGPVQGPIVNGDTTDDDTPTFSGTTEPNAIVVIYDNDVEIGRVPSGTSGDWSFTPSLPLPEGPHSFNNAVIDEAGNMGPQGTPIAFTVDTSNVEVSLTSAIDHVGPIQGPISRGGVTDDTQPTLGGKATASGVVKVYDGSTLIGQTTADTSGNWTLTPATGLSEGLHHLTATVTTAAAGESAPTAAFDLTVDLTAPLKPTIDQVLDDVGTIQGPIVNGGFTDDTTPTLVGKGEAGSTIYIYDAGSLLGQVAVDASGNWGFTPTTPLNEGPHTFTVIDQDIAGNRSVASDPFAITIDTTPPVKPSIDQVLDDVGPIQGPVVNGGFTDDTTPTLSGKGEAGTTIHVYDG
ncbi:MAG: Ig-like domain-containing protein, partial [Actinomycetes bacterium]